MISSTEKVRGQREATRSAVTEIRALGEANPDSSDFFAAFLDHVLAALAARNGAVWLKNDQGKFELATHRQLPAVVPNDPKVLEQHSALLAHVLMNGMVSVGAHKPISDDGQVGNSTDSLLLFERLMVGSMVLGLVEIFLPANTTPAAEATALRLLQQLCRSATDFLKSNEQRLLTTKSALWNRLHEFTQRVHSGLNSRNLAYTIANETQNFLECDRVTVALYNGKRATVRAISGQDTFDTRSNQVRLLTDVATTVARIGETIWYSGDAKDLSPQVEQSLQEYVDESHSKLIAIVPLHRAKYGDGEAQLGKWIPEEPVVGVLVIEQFHKGLVERVLRERTGVIAQHSSQALTNALEYESLFLLPLWRAIGKTKLVTRGRRLSWTVLVAIALVTILSALFLIRVDFEVESKGTLEPVIRRDAFTPYDGVVTRVNVEHGAVVPAGAPLVVLENDDLGVELSTAEGRLRETLEQLIALDRMRSNPQLKPDELSRLSGQSAEKQATRNSLNEQIALLKHKQEQLIVTSPIAGQVITWQVRDRLQNRPVQRGHSLLTVADPTGPWELELHVPENHAGFLSAAQRNIQEDLPVRFYLASRPGEVRTGKIRSVHTIFNIHGEEGNTVLARVEIDAADLSPQDLRQGVTTTAKIYCGRSSLFYSWFHDAVGWVQRTWFKI